jgi:hypothetical protein
VDVAAVVGRTELLQEPRRIAVEDDVVGRAGRTLRAEHEDAQARPRPAVVGEGGLERRAPHERRLAALEELPDPVALA